MTEMHKMIAIALLVFAAFWYLVSCRPAPHDPVNWCSDLDRMCDVCQDGSKCASSVLQCSPLGGCELKPEGPTPDVPQFKRVDAGK